MQMMVTDSSVIWDSWMEHAGSYGTFHYGLNQDSTRIYFTFQKAIDVMPDMEEFIFHDELFERDFEFVLQTKFDVKSVFNDTIRMRIDVYDSIE